MHRSAVEIRFALRDSFRDIVEFLQVSQAANPEHFEQILEEMQNCLQINNLWTQQVADRVYKTKRGAK